MPSSSALPAAHGAAAAARGAPVRRTSRRLAGAEAARPNHHVGIFWGSPIEKKTTPLRGVLDWWVWSWKCKPLGLVAKPALTSKPVQMCFGVPS